MKKPKLDPEVLAARYIAQLEADLKRERAHIDRLYQDLEFYRGKCERLETSIMESAPAIAAQAYARRTEPRRPSINSTRLETALRPKFSEIRDKWNKMTEAEQAKAIQEGWDLNQEEKVERG